MAEALGLAMQMDVFEVMTMLRHRYPFLFVDGVASCVPGSHIEGFKNVATRDAAGRGSIPHLVLVEGVAQVSVILTYLTLGVVPNDRQLMVFAGIEECRFHHAAYPGDRVLLRSELIRMRQSIGWFTGLAAVGGRTIVSLRMIAAIRAT